MDGLIEVFLNDHESALADRLAYLPYRLLRVGWGVQAYREIIEVRSAASLGERRRQA